MSVETGYLIEYGIKAGFFEPIQPTQKAFVTRQQLIKMMEFNVKYVVWSAKWINYSEYSINVGELPRLEI